MLKKICATVLNPYSILLLLFVIGCLMFQVINNIFIGFLIMEFCIFVIMSAWIGLDFLEEDGKMLLFIMLLIVNPIVAMAEGGSSLLFYYAMFLVATLFFIVK